MKYNKQSALEEIIYPDNARETWDRDFHNNTLVYRNVKGTETRFSYDLADRIKEVYQPDGNVISYHYDKDGNLSLYKDRDRQIYARYNIFGDVAKVHFTSIMTKKEGSLPLPIKMTKNTYCTAMQKAILERK